MYKNKKLEELKTLQQDLAYKIAQEECFAWAVYDKMSNQEKDEAIESYEKLYFNGLEDGYKAAQKEAEGLVEAHKRNAQVLRGFFDRLSVDGLDKPDQLVLHEIMVEALHSLKRSEQALKKYESGE